MECNIADEKGPVMSDNVDGEILCNMSLEENCKSDHELDKCIDDFELSCKGNSESSNILCDESKMWFTDRNSIEQGKVSDKVSVDNELS